MRFRPVRIRIALLLIGLVAVTAISIATPCKLTGPPEEALRALMIPMDAAATKNLWRHLREVRTDQRRIRLLEDTFAMTDGFPASELPSLTQSFEGLILGELQGDKLTEAAIAAIDACERHHAERVKDVSAALVGETPATKTVTAPPKLNELAKDDGELEIVADQDYSVTFERPDPILNGEHKVRFSKQIAEFLNDPSQKHPGREWLATICKGVARSHGQSGLKRPVTSDTVGQVYDFLVKHQVGSQNHMLGVVKLADGTLYIRDLFDHDSH